VNPGTSNATHGPRAVRAATHHEGLHMRFLSILLLLSCLYGVVAAPARAETVEVCTGTIDQLPATIDAQGTWCLDHDLSTALSGGGAITITTNNVTIDCNGFKVGGLAAGEASQAIGILAVDQHNVTVRNCGVRGFHRGIALGGSGHLVQDNRLDQNLSIGIAVFGDGHHVQDNRVFDTGGAPDAATSYGITGAGDMIGNAIDGVFATAANATVYGIAIFESGSEVRGNRVRNLAPQGAGQAYGLFAGADYVTLRGNTLSLAVETPGKGIYTTGTDTFCTDNVAIRFDVAYSTCALGFSNVAL